MEKKKNPNNDLIDSSEDYFREKNDGLDEEGDVYFPIEDSKPPHY